MSKQQEILLSAVWESSADAMRITDCNGKVLNVNDAYCTLTGFERKSIIGKPFVIVYDKKEQLGLQNYYLSFLSGNNKTERSNKKVKLSGDKRCTIEASYSQIEILGEKYVLAIIRDISEYKKAIEDLENTHKELIKSEEKYRAIIESSHDIVLMFDLNGCFTFANKRTEEITGHKISDLIGKSFIPLIHPDNVQRAQEGFNNSLQGKSDSYEFRIFDSKGKSLVLSVNTVPVVENNIVLSVVSICRDITDKKRSQEELKESENKYRQLVENSPDAIAIYVEGKIVFVNKECMRLMAAKCENELLGKTVLNFVHPEYRTFVFERMNKAMNEGNVLPFTEEKFIKLGGSEVDVEVKAVPVRLNNKPAVQLIIRDSTERKLTAKTIDVNEKRYQSLFEISPSGIVILDKNGIILETNDAISGILKYTKEELIGMNVRELSLTERHSQIDEDIKRILSGEDLEVEIENIRKDGTVCIIELRERAITLKSGEPGILASVNDITLRKQSQEAEISLREQINKILDLVPSYIFAKDYDGKFLMVNKSLADLFGVSPEEVTGKTDVDYGASKEQIKGYLKADREVIDSGKEKFIKEEQVLRKDGSLGWFQTHKIPYNHPGNNKPAILGVAVDITDRKFAEEVLKESENKYRELIDLAVDGILLGSHDGIVTDANKSLCAIVGMKKESFIGKHITYLPFKKESLEKSPFRFDLLNKGEIVLSERTLVRPDGKEIIVEVRSKMMPDGSYQSIYRNITDRKREELQIKINNEELTRLNNEKDKFFSIIAHDLRNPFQGFLGYTDLLKSNINSLTLNELQDIANNMNINAHILFELLTNLLEWSMMQRGLITFKPEKISLVNLTGENIILFSGTARQKGVEILEEIPEDIILNADKAMLANVLRNLISNAIKFTDKGGKVTISASKSENDAFIAVKDTGIGMKKDILNNLFNIDVRTNRNGTEDEPSTGLGLLLCKEYVEKHCGKISVKSKENQGSEFIVSLPLN